MVYISKLINNGLLLAGQSVFQDVATPQQASVEQYNIIRYLGGSAPYLQSPGNGISTDIPDQCTLEQVQLLSRHGERYPTVKKGQDFEKVLEKLNEQKSTFKGPLAFLNDYQYFVTDKSQYALETTPENSEGTYAGTTNLLRHGAYFRSRYSDLFNSNDTLLVFTSNSNRVHQSAESFARGFLGDQWDDDKVKINIIAEDATSGANSLTPGDSCHKYDEDANEDLVKSFNEDYLQNILDRLKKDNKDIGIKTKHVKDMFEYCAYEINVKGFSPFCDIFTNEDFNYYGYDNDLDKYYTTGPGNNLTATIGTVLLNASLTLLKDDSAKNKVWLSFTHDTDIDHFLSALGIFTPKEDLPLGYIDFDRSYIHAYIVPQAARIYTEKLKCGNDSYIRYVINDSVKPIPECSSGPGFSCKFDDFEKYIESRFNGRDFATQCGLPSNVTSELTFYWDYNTTDYNADLKI
ncbi:histidine phosphatase superfamily [Scheffersomyces xylosifermentans]|uniref:histidine phosphatase superfamily n=1 Tax=Scheffersomyces xylosifermentans TaxID=1304137 RepID=UPI00315CDBB7